LKFNNLTFEYDYGTVTSWAIRAFARASSKTAVATGAVLPEDCAAHAPVATMKELTMT
jgi:hypothetical protein